MEGKILCVTGPMASGKNAVCSYFEEKGFLTVDFDVLVHSAIENCTKQIVETFTAEARKKNIFLLNEDGSLNRRNLGILVFSDSNLLKKQESIVYPEVTRMAELFIKEHRQKNIVLNATVLYKIPSLLEQCELCVFVNAPVIKRFFRVCKRDKMPYLQILKRFYAQKNLYSEYKKTGIKIYNLKNNSTKQKLQKKIEENLLHYL